MDEIILLYSVVLFILGACIGSFLSVVSDRLPKRKSFFISRSYCESCKKTLKARDLIPLVSYLILGGKCRYCRKKIPAKLFFAELATGLVFLTLFILFVMGQITGIGLVYLLLIASVFIPIFLIDAELGIIPDELILTLLALTVSYTLLFNISGFFDHLMSGVGLFACFLALFLVTRGAGIGFGDVKLSFVLGFFLGFPNVLVGVYLAFLTGAVISIILVILGKKRLRGDTISFGPFLVVAAFLTYLYGDRIIRIVTGYFSL